MTENKQQGGGSQGPQPTVAEYKKSQVRVRELVEKRRVLERRLNQVEEGIVQKESAYLENTPSGNIITGFDNYMKGISGSAAQRRKTGPMDQNRVFSRSSISYRPNADSTTTPGSTPVSLAPTPSFRDGGATATATATASGAAKNSKKKKKQPSHHDVDDSENDGHTTKKRTNFGASRK